MPMQLAMAAKPYREPIRSPVGAVGGVGDGGAFVVPASQNPCGFRELVEFEVIGVSWVFSDGHVVEVNVATITITNLETGTSYVQTSDYRISTTVEADGSEFVVIDGSRWMGFLEGDQGPEGLVGRGGAEYFVTGHQTFVYDPKEDVITSYEVDGLVIDVCQVLA
jgi:hypothetical protein